MGVRLDLTGHVYGRLTVTSYSHTDNNRCRVWNATCSCGNTTAVPVSRLRNGNTTSCGCRKKEIIAERLARNWKHGGSRSTWYMSWAAMLTRCTNPKDEFWLDYGGRGITVCKRWYTAANFYADMGDRPKGYTLDRKNTDGNYNKRNCRWATAHEQASNRRNAIWITWKGERKPLTYWTSFFGVPYMTLYKRIHSRSVREVFRELANADFNEA